MFRALQRIIVWALVFVTAAPPAVLAEIAGGASPVPVPYGMMPGQAQVLPGQPIVTNPAALQPITPNQAPCPAPMGAGGGVEQLAAAGASPAQIAAASRTAPVVVPPPAAGGATSSPGIPKHPGLLSPVIQDQQRDLQGTITSGLPGQLRDDSISQLSIEDAFSRFFLLQGVTGQLKQFGYNFFDVRFSGLPPTIDAPVGPDYVVGPEDTLSIHIWNVPEPSLNRSYITAVERDGTIFIPQAGSIPVAGATFAQVTQIIRAKLSGLLKRFDLHVSMARLRTMKVYVVGEVVRPGAYELTSLATASHALYAACGPTKSGSLRHVQIVRGSQVLSDLDFYDFLLKGDRSQDLHLQSGDTVVVTPIGSVAAIGGPVKRPAIYELKGPTSLTAMIEMAGGLSPSADRRRCQIYRVEAGQKRVIVDIQLDQFMTGAKSNGSNGAPAIQDGDFVRIASVPTQIENAVTLSGAVRNPGPYEYRPGMKLLDLLNPDQLLVDSFLDRAELVRTDSMTYETTIQPFNPRAVFQGKEENLELRRLDKIVVATQARPPRMVSIQGEVKRPGTYTVESGERLSSVIKRAGGLTSRAFPQGLVMVRESVRKAQQAEIDKFVSSQKQRLLVEAANLTAGAVGTAQGGQTQNPDVTAVQLQMQALDHITSRIQVGRVVVKMDSVESLESSGDDLALEDGDQLSVPQRPQTVTIIGAVRNPANLIHREDLDAEDYIRQAGGFTKDANQKETYIVRADGSSAGGYTKVRTVYAGDTIIVPEEIEPKTRPLPLWQAIAGIVGSAALVAASIAVIGR
jgi:protein involved in polysaccharide export with SLBB domain